MPIAQLATATDLRSALLADHASLERRLKRLVTSARMDDWERLRAALSEFDEDLRAHFDAEEEVMLPKFERFDAPAAARIRDDHETIRKQLEALGVELDLHSLRATTVETFAARLNEHAALEESALYAWSQASLPEQEKSSLVSRLKARLRGTAES